MSHEFGSFVNELTINGMFHLSFFSNHNGFVHFIAYNNPILSFLKFLFFPLLVLFNLLLGSFVFLTKYGFHPGYISLVSLIFMGLSSGEMAWFIFCLKLGFSHFQSVHRFL